MFFPTIDKESWIHNQRVKKSVRRGKKIHTYRKTPFLSLILAVFLTGSAWAANPTGDLDNNGRVDLKDLLVFTGQWLNTGGCSDSNCADLSGDGDVNMVDFALLAENWYVGSPLVISEFMASNSQTLADENGDFCDWIEVLNISDITIDLDGWYLTDSADNLTKWRFPQGVELEAGEFLVVFASGRDCRDPDNPLHTNFQLSATGEYLAIVYPNGTVAHEYAPAYPQQCADISYGLSMKTVQTIAAVPAQSPVWHYRKGLSEASDPIYAWRFPDFNEDETWLIGQTSIGYGDDDDNTVLSDMRNNYSTVYLRHSFTISSLQDIKLLTLNLYVDDGCVVWINGTEIARRNTFYGEKTYDDVTNQSPVEAFWEQIILPIPYDYLVDGTNVLAIHVLNYGIDTGDLSIDAELLVKQLAAGNDPDLLNAPLYFQTPTPGAENWVGTGDLGPIIKDVQHFPLVPEDNEDIVVTAKITESFDPLDAGSVKLHYRVMFATEVAISMYDDGAHGDGEAGDDVYGASIPAGVSDRGEMVRWYIDAEDIESVGSRWPMFLYPTGSARYLGTVIADPEVTSSLPILHWFVSDTVNADLSWGTRASVFYQGQFYDNIFVRSRGGSTASAPCPSHKFDFNRGEHFQFDPGLPRVAEFNLNTNYYEKSYVRQSLGYETYDKAGTPGCEGFLIRVERNGRFYSLDTWIEQVDEDMLKREELLDSRGALYKVVYCYDDVWDNPSVIEKKTRLNESRNDLRAFVEGISPYNPDRQTYMLDNVNIPEVITYIAATSIMNDRDHLHKNHYLYRDTEGNCEWQVLPWDKDLTFGRNYHGLCHDIVALENTYYAGSWSDGNRVIGAIWNTPLFQEMYLRRLRTLMDELLQSLGTPTGQLKLEERLDEMLAMALPDAELDFLRWGNPWVCGFPEQRMDEAIQIMKDDFLVPIRDYLYSAPDIPSAQPANPDISFGTIEFNPASYNQDEEYIELINNESTAIDISGWKVTGAVEHTFQPGVVIPQGGILYISPNVKAFRSRPTSPTGGENLFIQGDYRGHLSSWGETINLIDTEGGIVDTITYTGNPSEQQKYLRITELMYHPKDPCQSSSYDGEDFEFIELKNIGPDTLNLAGVKFTDGITYNFPGDVVETIIDVNVENITLVNHSYSWKYDRSDTDLGTAWRQVGYDDSTWSSGSAVLYKESSSLPSPWVKNTEFSPYDDSLTTYYFRTHFNLNADPYDTNVNITLEVNTLIDDGAVIYLNGAEAERIGMPDGEITHSTYASRVVTDATNETFSISPNLLVEGDNVLAVEVHQGAATSSDIVFGLTLDANITTTTTTIIPDSNSITLDPNEYVLVVKDPNAFAERYPSVPVPAEKILGPYIGQLDNGGETVKLEDFTNSTIQEFSYDDGWYPITDGIGFSLVVIDCNEPNLDTWDDRTGWRPSAAIDGSPGADDASPVQNPGAVVINEVLAHSHESNPDWIELHNSTEEPINVGGWFLSDDNLVLTKYEIEIGTSIPPNGYIVFYEDVNFGYGSPDPGSHTGFALSENGETVYLSSGLDGQLTGYSEDEDFGASETGIAFGRYYKSSTDTYNFVAMSLNTPGSANAYPKVGPIVINEIMYHPEPDGDAEYIELYNIENYAVDLQEYDNEQLIYVPWKLTDGIEFTFPLGVTIPPYGYLLVVSDMTAFNAAYPGVPGGVQKFQADSGKLANDGEKVELGMPGDMDGGVRVYIRIDRINYDDEYPWPTEPDGENGDGVSSLTRIDPYLYGNDPNNWQAALPTPSE